MDAPTSSSARRSSRLEHTTLESQAVYYDAVAGAPFNGRFTLLSAVAIERRRVTDRDQLTLFPTVTASEPGEAQVDPRAHAPRQHRRRPLGRCSSAPQYLGLSSPVARRLYRLLEVARAEGHLAWRVALEHLAEQLPLSQRYRSHLQRVLQPAHEMLLAAGLLRDVVVRQHLKEWYVDYVLASRVV